MRPKTYNHSESFYRKKHNEYLNKMRAAGQEPTNRLAKDFKAAYEMMKADQEAGIESSKQSTVNLMVDAELNVWSGTSARALKKAIKNKTGQSVKVSEIRRLSRADLIARYGNDIKQFYDDQIAAGKDKNAARKAVSEFWFGSP